VIHSLGLQSHCTSLFRNSTPLSVLSLVGEDSIRR
jgi:hypothetical protein